MLAIIVRPEAAWLAHGVISLHCSGLLQVDDTEWGLGEEEEMVTT